MREGQHDYVFHINESFSHMPEYWRTGNFEVIDIPKIIYTDPTLFPCSNELIPKRIFSHHLGMHFTEHVTYSIIRNQEIQVLR